MVFENRVLRSIFGLKWNEIIGGWRILHNEEHHNLYSSPNMIAMNKTRRMKWEGCIVARIVDKRTTYRVLVGEPEGKTQVGRRRQRWEDDNIKMDLRERGWVIWTGYIWLRIETNGGLS
jgi:hypothetical protein